LLITLPDVVLQAHHIFHKEVPQPLTPWEKGGEETTLPEQQ
jgi:hypothetical protein